MATVSRMITQISGRFRRIEDALLCLLLGAMIVLACLQIALRGLVSGGLLWLDPLLRYLVLWSGLLGAAAATARGKHIALDLASYLIPPAYSPWLRLAIHLFSALVALALTWAAIRFVASEAEFGGTALLGLPSWGWNLIFPLAFAVMALRFFLAGLADLRTLAGTTQATENGPGR